MTATDELRRLLNERGVKYLASEDNTTIYYADSGHRYTYNVNHDSGWAQLYGYHLTPAQAIAATLGNDDTFTREDVEGAFVSGYSLGLDMFDSSKPDNEKGWNQNERNLDEEMEDLGWVRKDAATLSAGTCHEVEDEDTGFIVCSECGAVHDTDYTNYYCWCCGRKVVGE